MSATSHYAPIYREVLADVETPVSALLKLGAGPGSFLLESVEGGEFVARYSFVAAGLERSLAITPGTGRTHVVLAAAYEALGRHEEAKEAIAKTLQLRPGSNIDNVALPSKNQSPRYLRRVVEIKALLRDAGLPER